MVQPLIWVDGIIGAGKTTAVIEIGKALKLEIFQEPLNEDLLKIYYEDQNRWGFSFQIDMLNKRFAVQSNAAFSTQHRNGAIIDRALPGDRVFAQMLMKDKKIHPINWEIYETAYSMFIQSLIPPNLLIFLDVTPEVAYQRIKGRSREAENSSLLPMSYLRRLHSEYQKLLTELASGEHPWSSQMEIWLIDWNKDWRSMKPMIENIKIHFRVLNFFYQKAKETILVY
ncbi:MAG: deoxynucleoside kinase [Candidatus Hodarchaeales archaeon]|jgi:deoxyadenosine/deoxycytidine kinase